MFRLVVLVLQLIFIFVKWTWISLKLELEFFRVACQVLDLRVVVHYRVNNVIIGKTSAYRVILTLNVKAANQMFPRLYKSLLVVAWFGAKLSKHELEMRLRSICSTIRNFTFFNVHIVI